MSERAFDGVTVLLIDGNNLLHRVSGSVEPGAQRLLLARLRGAIPATLATVLMLDGHADSGTSRTERVGRGLEIRHSGSISADDALLRLIDKYQPAERSGVTVVTDDRAFTERARRLGAHTQRLAWLEVVIGMPGEKGAAIGAGKPPTGRPSTGKPLTGRPSTGKPLTGRPSTGKPLTGRPATHEPHRTKPDVDPSSGQEPTDDREPWRPGRGATRKRGNPKRRSR